VRCSGFSRVSGIDIAPSSTETSERDEELVLAARFTGLIGGVLRFQQEAAGDGALTLVVPAKP
jgi:hypothetical protein